jgi:hypothetical protein
MVNEIKNNIDSELSDRTLSWVWENLPVSQYTQKILADEINELRDAIDYVHNSDICTSENSDYDSTVNSTRDSTANSSRNSSVDSGDNSGYNSSEDGSDNGTKYYTNQSSYDSWVM